MRQVKLKHKMEEEYNFDPYDFAREDNNGNYSEWDFEKKEQEYFHEINFYTQQLRRRFPR